MSYKSREKKRQVKRQPRRPSSRTASRYWLTPKVWNRRCSHCNGDNPVAYRPKDHKIACQDCIDSLGIDARESQAWKDGGAQAGAAVVIRYVEPSEIGSVDA